MSTPARQGYRFRGARQLANAIEQHQREVRTAGRALGGKLSEDERTTAQTALRNAEASLSTARWELQRQERADMIPGLDTSRAGVPDQLHEPLCIGRYTNIEPGGLRLNEVMTQRLGQAYSSTRKEADMRDFLWVREVAELLGYTDAFVRREIDAGHLHAYPLRPGAIRRIRLDALAAYCHAQGYGTDHTTDIMARAREVARTQPV